MRSKFQKRYHNPRDILLKTTLLNYIFDQYFIQEIYSEIYNQNPPEKLGLQKSEFLLKDYYPTNFDLFKKKY